MKEMFLEIEKKEELKLNEDIEIKAIINGEEDMEYKFIEGYNKIWTPIQGFSEKNICTWIPKKSGKHMILVQGKIKNSEKPYDYKSLIEIDVNEDIKVIKEIDIEKSKLVIGEKSKISIKSDNEIGLYRFSIKKNGEWSVTRDYSTEKEYTFTANEVGIKEILVEGKRIGSTNNVDEYRILKIDVKSLSQIEIVDFKCLTKEILVDEIIEFSVEANYKDNRPILYKFLKIDKGGRVVCIQDFSSNSTVSFKEFEVGKHKILCVVRDMFSNKEYDDRALITYEVNSYKNIKIKNFKADVVSPQTTDTAIILKAEVDGGKEVFYKYEIEGPISENSGYTRSHEYLWKPSVEGDYIVRLKVKDDTFEGEYEDTRVLNYRIDKKACKPVRILDIKCDRGRKCIVNDTVNITVKSDGGSSILYSFLVYKDNILIEEVDYGKCNWVNFTPQENGEFEVEARVKDLHSEKEYESSSSIYIKCNDYIDANIDYLIINNKEVYLVDELIEVEPIIQNTKDVVVRFVTKINGMQIEDSGFVKDRILKIYPRCIGKYTIEVYAKNIKSDKEYDTKKDIVVNVKESVPVADTKIKLNKCTVKIGEEVIFQVDSKGGKDVCYEFYIMKNGVWNLIQKYSKKNYYRFFPFDIGKYRILVLSKSFYKKEKYEDFDSIYFEAVKS